jgi:hypothetical protein
MFMKSPIPGSLPIAMFIMIGLCIAITGCIGGNSFPKMDILVSRYDSSGQNIWSTTIDSGKDDYANAIIETSGGGYAIAGWISEKHGYPNNPRVIRLDTTGRKVWDRTLDSSEVYSVAIAEAPDGGFVVAQNINNFDSGRISRIDADGRPVWNRTIDSAFKTITPTRDGGFALAGTRTFLIDGNGTTVWDLPIPSTSILQSADGDFFVDQSGEPYPNGSVFRIDAHGTVVWTRPVGSHTMGKITSMHENSQGEIEVVYTFGDPKKDKDLIRFMESELVTLAKKGNMTGIRSVVAVDPLCRTRDGGFSFLAYPFPDSTAFTTLTNPDSFLHMVRLSPQGAVVWDKSLDLRQWIAPQEILETRDGGFVTLVVPGS